MNYYLYISLVYFRCIDISNKNIINYIITIFKNSPNDIYPDFTPPQSSPRTSEVKKRLWNDRIHASDVGDSFILVTF